MSGDEIELMLPADEAFNSVAHLVLGGLAVRMNLTFENLEDLELALDALLERAQTDGVTLRVRVLDDALHTTVGPFSAVRAELEQGGGTDQLTLSRILSAVCDSVEISDRDGGEWVELTTRLKTTNGAGG